MRKCKLTVPLFPTEIALDNSLLDIFHLVQTRWMSRIFPIIQRALLAVEFRGRLKLMSNFGISPRIGEPVLHINLIQILRFWIWKKTSDPNLHSQFKWDFAIFSKLFQRVTTVVFSAVNLSLAIVSTANVSELVDSSWACPFTRSSSLFCWNWSCVWRIISMEGNQNIGHTMRGKYFTVYHLYWNH